MKGSLLGKFTYLFCFMAGVLVGYGIVTLTNTKENIGNTKDNTLLREAGDSVFFVENKEEIKQPEFVLLPSTQTQASKEDTAALQPTSKPISLIEPSPISIYNSTSAEAPTIESMKTSVVSAAVSTITPIPKVTAAPAMKEDNTDISKDKLPS